MGLAADANQPARDINNKPVGRNSITFCQTRSYLPCYKTSPLLLYYLLTGGTLV